MEHATFEKLLTISRNMAEIRAFAPLLAYTLKEAIAFVQAERGYIILQQSDQILNFHTRLSFTGEDIQNPQDQVSMSIINRVLFEGVPILTHDAARDPDFETAESVRGLQLRSVLCVPLISQGEVLGAIFLENRTYAGIFDQNDLDLLTLFANQAAVNVANARLIDELETRVVERTAELATAKHNVERGWQEAVELNRLQSILMGNVAHDLRSPLAVAVSSLTLMLEGAFGSVTDEQTEWLNNALRALNLAVRLTNDIFDMTKLEHGKLTLDKQPTHMTEFLHEIYQIGRGLQWSEQVEFKLEIDEPLPTLLVDSVRIQQVLLNLISNSLKYTRQGSVTLFAQVYPDHLLLGVRDTGEGIASDMLEKIFERFQQLESHHVSQRQGAGLGLAICKELVLMHGGDIWAESEPNKGTTLQFTLPIHRQ